MPSAEAADIIDALFSITKYGPTTESEVEANSKRMIKAETQLLFASD